MSRHTKLCLAVLTAGLLPAAGYCGATSLGETASMRASVRANGMGDAYTAAGDDLFGSYYNPAQTAPKSAGLVFSRGYAEDSTGLMSVYFPKALGGLNIGLSFLYYSAGDMDLYGSGGKIGTVNAERDVMGTLNVSREFGLFSAGANAKVLRTTLFEETSAAAFLCDFGVKAKLGWFDAGASVQNLGEEMTLGNEDERIPRTVRAGLYRGCGGDKTAVNLAADVVKTENEKTYFAGGVEFVYNKMLALRTGYEFQNTLSEANMLRFGFGVKVKDFSLDYALVPYKDLGSTHRFGVVYAFACGKEKAAREEAAETDKPARAAEPVEAVKPAEAVTPVDVEPAAPAAA